MPLRAAAFALLALIALGIAVQGAVLAGWLPSTITFGGRLEEGQRATRAAAAAIAALLLMALVPMARIGLLGERRVALGRWGAWALFAFFVLNTAGNLLARDMREALAFTPITAIAALLAYRLARRSP